MISIKSVAALVRPLRSIKGIEHMSLGVGGFSYRYWCTPPDVFPFAWTGGDGIHFGLLSDFGAVQDPAKAFVVCVSPAGGIRVKVIARNFREFLSLASTVLESEFLERLDPDDVATDWLSQWQRSWFDADELRQVRKIAATLKRTMSLRNVADPVACVRAARLARSTCIATETLDGLGIRRTSRSSSEPVKRFPFAHADGSSVRRMRSFLAGASHDETLAFCRDAQHSFILARDYDVRILELVAKTLSKIGLEREARNLLKGGSL